MLNTRVALGAAIFVLGMLDFAPVAHAADQVVVDCSSDTELRSDLTAMQADGGGKLTFNCGSATIVLTAEQPTITTSTTVDGGGKITISGNNARRIFTVAVSGTLTTQNIVLTNGSTTGDGGAIFNNGTLVLQHTTIRNSKAQLSGGAIITYGPLNIDNSELAFNEAQNAGAIFPRFAAASVFISNSNIHHNKATNTTDGWGGAMLLWGAASAAILNTDIHDNSAKTGGAICLLFAESGVSLQDSQMRDNTATSEGGGVYAQSGVLTMNRVLVSGNLASSGAGVAYSSVTFSSIVRSTFRDDNSTLYGGGVSVGLSSGIVLQNVTFSGCRAAFGGAVNNVKSTMSLTNVTIHGCEATIGASGVSSNTYTGQGTTMKNTVIAASQGGPNCHVGIVENIISTDGNYSSDSSCAPSFDKLHDQNGGGDPQLLAPLALNGGTTPTFVPMQGSPLVDAGVSDAVPSIDQRGVIRPQGAAYDIGAVEVASCDGPVPVVCGDANSDGAVSASDALRTLRSAVGSATCSPWLCDYNGDGSITASDALGILRKAVGQVTATKCPAAWDCHGA